MRLSRLPQESLESFINRAEIYRRENQSSLAYQVGSQFYVGHLLDAAKLTKRDQALIKAACGGTLEDEDLVTNAISDLADQLEKVWLDVQLDVESRPCTMRTSTWFKSPMQPILAHLLQCLIHLHLQP